MASQFHRHSTQTDSPGKLKVPETELLDLLMVNTERVLHCRLLEFVRANLSISQCLYMGYIQHCTGMLLLETPGKHSQ